MRGLWKFGKKEKIYWLKVTYFFLTMQCLLFSRSTMGCGYGNSFRSEPCAQGHGNSLWELAFSVLLHGGIFVNFLHATKTKVWRQKENNGGVFRKPNIICPLAHDCE